LAKKIAGIAAALLAAMGIGAVIAKNAVDLNA